MKIAVSAVDTDPSSKVETRFGRAKQFLIFNTESDTWETLQNEVNLNAVQGAGIQSAEMLARSGVQAVITGHCGPKAFQLLRTSKIDVYLVGSRTVQEAVRELTSGKLSVMKQADVESHW